MVCSAICKTSCLGQSIKVVSCLIVVFVGVQIVILIEFIIRSNTAATERVLVVPKRSPNWQPAWPQNSTIKKGAPGSKAEKVQLPIVNPLTYDAQLEPPNPCDKHVFLFICVHSAPGHFHKRNFIRQTWGNVTQYGKNVKVLFFLGYEPDRPQQSKMVNKEHREFQDTIVYNFIDSYMNLTIKAMVELEYVVTKCKHATFILKADDDVLINMFELLHFLNSSDSPSKDKLLLGLAMYVPPITSFMDVPQRVHMSPQETPPSDYIQFVSGMAYVLTPDTALVLYRKAQTLKYFWVDDVFLTGIVGQRVAANISRFNAAYVLDFDYFLQACENSKCKKSWIFTHAANQPVSSVIKLWKTIAAQYEKPHESDPIRQK